MGSYLRGGWVRGKSIRQSINLNGVANGPDPVLAHEDIVQLCKRVVQKANM